jgi:RNA polymerase sigma-70 factor (ECF subfamily)
LERQQVLERLRERIVSFAASRVSRDRAEDLAQEALLLLTQKYPAVERLEDLLPLSFKIVRFKMSALWKKAARRGEASATPPEDLDLTDERPNPEEVTEWRERLDHLMSGLARLEDRCRELFRLMVEGKTFAEIKEVLQANSINTVFTWDLRCRKRLLALMGGSWSPEGQP